MAKLPVATRKKSTVVPKGSAHAARPGYASIDANQTISGQQEHVIC